VKSRRCDIRCAIVIIPALVFMPGVILAQGVAFAPKDAAIAAYMDRLEAGVLRMREEERMLKVLSQEQAMDYLSKKQPLGEQPEPALEQPESKKSVFTASRNILEDMFENAEFRTSLGATMQYNDNVGLTKENTKSDWIYNLNPSWDLKLTRGQSYLGLNYNYNFGYYLKHTSVDSQSQRFAATLFYRPSHIFSFQLNESFEGTNGSDLFNLVPFTIDRFNSAHHRVSASSLSGVFTYMPWGRTNLAHLTLSDNRAYSEDRSLNNITQALGFNIEHYLNPITSLYLGMDFSKTTYEEWDSKYSNSRSMLLGLKYDLTNITKLRAQLSYSTSAYEEGDSEEGYNLNCSLSHKLSNFTALSGTYTFGLSNSASGDYRRYHRHNLNLSLNHQLGQRLSLSLGTTFALDNYFKEDYIGTAGPDDKERRQYGFNFGLGHRLYNWLSLNFSYGHSRILSEFPAEGYIDNVYTWGATFNF